MAADDGQLWRLDRAAVSELIAANATFGALLFAELSQKLNALAERHGRHELHSLTMAWVHQVGVRPAWVVDAATDIVSVVRRFTAERTTHVRVRDRSQPSLALGIFTTAGLQRAILQGVLLEQWVVGSLTSRPLVTVGLHDHLFDALAAMIRHRERRVVVLRPRPDGSLPAEPAEADLADVAGMLDPLDSLSFLSNHTHLVTRQFLEAPDLDALATGSRWSSTTTPCWRDWPRQ